MCYGSRCNLIDRIKIRNKISVWHEILTYLLSPDGVLKIYKVECSPGENNNLVTSDSHPNYVVRPFNLFYTNLTLPEVLELFFHIPRINYMSLMTEKNTI